MKWTIMTNQSNPFEQSMPSAETIDRQRSDRDRLVRAAIFAADCQLITSRPRTNAEATRIAVTAAISYIIGHGLVTVLPDDQWPYLLSIDVPEHMA